MTVMLSLLALPLALAAAVVGTSSASASSSSPPKHILFVMVDDLGFNDVSYRNTSDLSSPTIDQLALSGVRLERYYTHNLCSPSRTAFLSGRYASSVGMQGCVIINGQAVDLPSNVSTVADRLGKGGFKSAAIGKWDAGMTTWDYTPTCRGFDYFYGFYGPAQDHYTHASGGAIDLRENFVAQTQEQGVYSTNLYTSKAVGWVEDMVGRERANRTFVYLAYQAMHAPIEAPQHYIDSPQCSKVTKVNDRKTFCGMMVALDEGVANVTAAYKSLGIWADTVLVLAADNGGHVGASGNNAPLRGEKSSNYEGGVRGVSFLHWDGLPAALRGTAYSGIVHVSDWLATFVGGVAGLALEADGWPYPLDGVDQWEAITTVGSAPARNPAAGLLHEIGGDNNVPQQAYMEGPYKLVKYHPVIYDYSRWVCTDLECPMGWNPLPGHGLPSGPPSAENRTNGTAALLSGGTWLFDVFADPLEHTDLSQKMPDVVARLEASLEKYVQRGIVQRLCPVDPASSPAKYFGDVWTPWRGNSTPGCNAGGSNAYCLPTGPPKPPSKSEGSFDGITVLDSEKTGARRCAAKGWCSGPGFSGPALEARVQIDGVTVSTANATVNRPAAGDHGFELPIKCSDIGGATDGNRDAIGSQQPHKVDVSCFHPAAGGGSGGWSALEHSPKCYMGGRLHPCQ